MPDLKRLSKFLSYVLRHRPDSIGLTVEAGGWVSVAALLAAAQQDGVALDLPTLQRVVAESDKQRFRFSEDGTRIRANQGHSLPVDLGLEPRTPPTMLFHGTARRLLPAILAEGLRKMRRHHVHLSTDEATAHAVGQRHGEPVVLTVDSEAMHAAGHLFYRSANGVWLTDHVPVAFLSVAPPAR